MVRPEKNLNNFKQIYPFEIHMIHKDVKAVYIFFNKEGDCLYVGRSKRLKGRLYEHFRGEHRIDYLEDQVYKIQYMIEENENARLYLEDLLIHRLFPKYNERVFNIDKIKFIEMVREETL
ncbi:nucleotide excision repair endonuclease [Peribacillus butanolivorans]|uniref:nucleotide excision repair endonuclease n=1 Tax=Peribacillus butanolivorans TaxID=421767 RepID=UPI00366DBBFC